jgi:hypothetical protein
MAGQITVAALELPAADDLATKSWGISLFEQCHKARLLEMTDSPIVPPSAPAC